MKSIRNEQGVLAGFSAPVRAGRLMTAPAH